MYYVMYEKEGRKVTKILGSRGDRELPEQYPVPDNSEVQAVSAEFYQQLETDFFQKDITVTDLTKTEYEEAFELTDKIVEEVTEPPSLEEQVAELQSALAITQDLLNQQMEV